MRQPRLLVGLASAILALTLIGCRLAPGDLFGRNPDPSAAGESALAGAGPADSGVPPGAPTGPGGTIRVPPGIYLASYIALDVRSDYHVPLVVAPNVGAFPAGEIELVIVDKWGGLPPGAHREEMQILGPDGRTVLAADFTEFEIGPDHVYLTIASPFTFTADPGWHQVAIALDGTVVMRYQFLVQDVS